MLSPIEIIFYDDEDAVLETYSRNRIPAYILDMAIDLGKNLAALDDAESTASTQERTAPLFDFIVELFGNKFTREELKQHADLVDCFSVYRAVLTRANSLAAGMANANPRVPSRPRK